MTTYSVSRIKKYQACPRAYKYNYIDRYKEATVSPQLEFGSAVHLGLEAFYGEGKTHKYGCDVADKRVSFAIEGLMRAYAKRYGSDHDDYDVVDVEKKFQIEVCGKPFQGVVDLVLRRKKDNALVIMEHKTTARLTREYWLKTDFDPQVALYMKAIGETYGEMVDMCIYNVIVKPSVPAKIEIDNVEEYAYNSCSKKPDKYFARRNIIMTKDRMCDIVNSLGRWADVESNDTDYNMISPSPTCNYCPYIEVCSGHATLETSRLIKPKEVRSNGLPF